MRIHLVLLTAALALAACSKPVVPSAPEQLRSASAPPAAAVQPPVAAPATVAAAPATVAVEIPPPAATKAHVKVKSRTKDGAVYVSGERIGKGECNGLFAEELIGAVDLKINVDVANGKVRDFGNILADPSVIKFRAKCASLPA